MAVPRLPGGTVIVYVRPLETTRRTSSGMYERLPKVSSPRPGDLVYYGNPVFHMGIYLGDGLMVDAPRSGDVVRIMNIHNFGSPPKYTTVPA